MALFNNPPKAVEPQTHPAPPVSNQENATDNRVKESQPVVVLSEQDSYIREMIQSQPSDLAEVSVTRVDDLEKVGFHRLSLPDYFERISYDCTRGDSCTSHKKRRVDMGIVLWKTEILNRGKYVFRWVNKNKRALDSARNVRQWNFVNRFLFPDAPKELFRASGALEEGDAVLMFMTAERATKLREIPGQHSNDLLKGRITRTRKGVLMTGNPDDDRVYQPDLGTSKEEAAEDKANET